MKHTYTYKSKTEGMLYRSAIMGLMEKIDPTDENYKVYEKIIKKEIKLIEDINFDGWMLLLADVIMVSREISGFVSAFGSIQNSLTAYALGIIDVYEFNEDNFKKFTPFVKKPVVNIVICSYANSGCMGFVKFKYKKLIKKSTKRAITFNEKLKIKFIDLGIDISRKD